jgi:hypothetical protein
LWKNNALSGNVVLLQYLLEFCVENEIILDEHVKISAVEHLANLELNFERYFPSSVKIEHGQLLWILNPFDDNATEQAGISGEIKEQLSEFSSDSVLKMQGMERDVSQFWLKMKAD